VSSTLQAHKAYVSTAKTKRNGGALGLCWAAVKPDPPSVCYFLLGVSDLLSV
jgi:hypothetical protein